MNLKLFNVTFFFTFHCVCVYEFGCDYLCFLIFYVRYFFLFIVQLTCRKPYRTLEEEEGKKYRKLKNINIVKHFFKLRIRQHIATERTILQ